MRGLGIAALLLLGPGCLGAKAGYALYELEQSYANAQQQNAAELAVYELTLSEAYRAKAWEEAGYNQYEAAETLIAKASEMADVAAKLAREEAAALRLLEEMSQDEELVPEQVPVEPKAEESAPEAESSWSEPAPEEERLDEWVE
jgi:hypothetical protein